MDEFSGKRAVNGLVVSRKSSGLVFRETVANREKIPQFCSRIGCSSRLDSMKGTQIGCSEKAKSSRPSFRFSSSDKETVGSYSRASSVLSNARKSSTNTRKKLPSQLETDSSETSSVHDEPDVSELILSPGKIQRGLLPESEDSDYREVVLMEEGSSSVTANSRSRRTYRQRSGVGSRDGLVSSSVSLVSRKTSQATSSNTSNHGLRNVRFNSKSDAIPSSSSLLSDSSLSRRKDMVKKRYSEGESSSSSRGNKTSETSLEMRNHNSNNGISIYESRRTRNWPSNRDNVIASVRTRRSTNSNNRARISNQGNGNSLAPNEFPAEISRVPESEIPVDSTVPTSLLQFSAESLSVHPSSYSRPGSSRGGLRRLMPGSPSEFGGITHSSISRDSFASYNIDGIAEVLLALERIEQDDELSYEQLLVLENNLLLNGLNFYDQHRDMRLDIDNMSYEELLALEERMGTVSTALTEEAISNCLKTSIYQPKPLKFVAMSCSGNNDYVKCSICQEEFVVGDEVGRLHCQHWYHVVCIKQWLRLKNWCPICKAPADSALSSDGPEDNGGSDGEDGEDNGGPEDNDGPALRPEIIHVYKRRSPRARAVMMPI